MDWQSILEKCRNIKIEFEKSYKCLNLDRPTKDDTIQKHLKILIYCLEDIRTLLNVNYERFTPTHKIAAEAFYQDARDKVLKITTKKNFDIKISANIHERIEIEKYFPKTNTIETAMSQTVVEFLNTASKLISDFDGKAENLRSFLDSIALVDSIKGSHEIIAVSLIKTKLKGNTRNIINNENTITDIVNKLQNTIKGESVEVITAKIMNIKQNSKTANTYCSEIETITKSLENAYITDGVPSELANQYATQAAVKAMTKNCTNDKVKLIMEAGQFNNMNEVISKFVNSCTEATGQQNAILHFKQRPNNNSYRRNYNSFRGRNNYTRNNNRNNNNNNRNNNNTFNQGRTNNGRNRNYVHTTTSNERDSENSNPPLGSDQ